MSKRRKYALALSALLLLVLPASAQARWGKEKALAAAEATRDGDAQAAMSVSEGTLEEARLRIDPSTNIPDQSPGMRATLEAPVFLVAMSGNFTLSRASVRPGDPPPTGNVLDLVIDAHTGAIIGRALPAENAPVGPPLANVAATGTRGVLAGRVKVSGGPPPRRGQKPGPKYAVGYKVLVKKGRRVVKTVTTTAKGFSARLVPGRYTLAGTQGYCPPVNTSVQRGRTTRVTLKCSIR
ncbi:MAG: hypothetical protein ACLQBB_04350 [Solirubrobacteraceae bacterium]